jgi:mono/diheme cytochrome c family protein
VRKFIIGVLAVAFAGALSVGVWRAAADEAEKKTDDKASADVECCKVGDTTPPTELVEKVPPGGLRSPYQDYAKLAKDDPDLVKQFRLPGCNECHGGTGGGGFCPALTQGVWFWGNTDDVLFRLVTLGSAEIEKRGFVRYQYGSVHAPMPPMGMTIKTSDQLWKIIAFIRSINPPGANPPEKVIPGKMAEETK